MKHKIKIKWKIFIYMLAFTAILLAILWFFQTVYLEEFYKYVKMSEMDNAIDNVMAVIDDEEIQTAVETIGQNYDMSVAVVAEDGSVTYTSDTGNESYISVLNNNQRKSIILKALQDGEYVRNNIKESNIKSLGNVMKPEDIPDKEDYFGEDFKRPDNNGYNKMPNMPAQLEVSGVLKVKTVKNSEGTDVGIFVYSVITPVGATVQTLRIQLIYISIIMVVLALVLALAISFRVSKPIVKINNAAKKMAKGDYGVKFEGNGYLEVAELSKTLNNTAIELGKAEKLQRELLANVSHDLRTPLTMITAYSEVMRDIPGENTPENVQVIIDEARRLTTLVNDLLDISKLQAGVTSFEMKRYNLTESIQAVIERIRKLMENEGYVIEFIHDEIVYVNADEYKIYQVLYNLINNAIAYTGEDKKITVIQKKVGSIVRIEVVDTGQGIAPEELKNVWDRYYKVDKNHKRAVTGTGLGLSIVKNILTGHNARFGVNSKVSEGSTFWFELKVD